MPLSTKEKSARHRARINNDPASREAYLANRKESYQRMKREGNIVKPPISQLSEEEKKKNKATVEARSEKAQGQEKGHSGNLEFHTRVNRTPAELEPNSPNKDDIVSIKKKKKTRV